MTIPETAASESQYLDLSNIACCRRRRPCLSVYRYRGPRDLSELLEWLGPIHQGVPATGQACGSSVQITLVPGADVPVQPGDFLVADPQLSPFGWKALNENDFLASYETMAATGPGWGSM